MLKYFCAFLFFSQFLISQETGLDFYRDIENGATLQLNGLTTVKNSEVDGSFFKNDNFVKGYVYDSYKETKTKLLLRYDVFNDIFEVKLNKDDSSIKKIKRTVNFEYILEDEKFVLIQAPSIINKKHYVSGNGYVSVIKSFIDDKLILYKRYIKEYNPPVKAKTMYDKDKPATLKNEYFYILKIRNSYYQLEINKRKISDAFPKSYQSELKKFIKSKKYRFRGNDEDVENQISNLIEYYQKISINTN